RHITEDPSVKAPCWFSRMRTDINHVPAQILRLLIKVIFAPLYCLVPHEVVKHVANFAKASWAFELASTPDAVLTTAP
ncbi:hypothetical protein ARMGADRAFT_895427, partial [Armillaria gallica]